jgi:ParB family chromosome partitioning protein
LSFAAEIAAKLGVSERDIQRSIRRYQKIAPDIREKIATTWIADKGNELDALVRLGHAEQRKVVRLMLQEAHPAKSVAAARKALSGGMDDAPDVDAEQLKRLVAAWNKAGAKARAAFRKFLASEKA